MEDVDKEISEMKLSLNARARVVAESYLTVVRAHSNRRPHPADQLCSLVDVNEMLLRVYFIVDRRYQQTSIISHIRLELVLLQSVLWHDPMFTLQSCPVIATVSVNTEVIRRALFTSR